MSSALSFRNSSSNKAMIAVSSTTNNDNSSISMSTDPRNVSDDRIHPRPRLSSAEQQPHAEGFETTVDGDVVIVQPSFDDDKTSTSNSPQKFKQQQQQNWQEEAPRSPQQEQHHPQDGPLGPDADNEGERQMASPPTSHRVVRPGHTRDLSAHFYDATSLGNTSSEDSGDGGDVYKTSKKELSRKHRRMMSGGMSNPNHAHRRLNSIGQAAPVKRHHQRVDSQGLEILSTVADGEDMAEEQARGSSGNKAWEPPASSLHHHSRLSQPGFSLSEHHRRLSSNNGLPFGHFPPTPTYPPHPGMAPPAYGAPPPPYPPAPTNPHHSPYYMPPGYPPSSAAARTAYPPPPPQQPQYPSQHPMYSPAAQQQQAATQQQQGMMYPPKKRAPQAEAAAPFAPSASMSSRNNRAETTTAGSQTFVTAMAVGNGTKTIRPTIHSRHASTNTDFGDGKDNVPTHIGTSHHHRKMSSFSSLGLATIFPPSIMSPLGEKGDSQQGQQPHPLKQESHHRSSSSSVSFLNLGMDPDDTFLRNLQDSNADYCRPVATTSAQATVFSLNTGGRRSNSPPNAGSGSEESSSDAAQHDSKLASGGTSKRVRRKCNVAGCPNRVVQGGLCISHGAKRKSCKHPGCNKNVKKAGLCSTHGPARKRCEAPGCPKVAVQGGRCIAHGAKKKLCCVEDCEKQAILSGMCKRHHDEAKQQREAEPRSSKPKHAAKHTRGISIFHDLSADTVQTLLNSDTIDAAPPSGAPPPPPSGGGGAGWA